MRIDRLRYLASIGTLAFVAVALSACSNLPAGPQPVAATTKVRHSSAPGKRPWPHIPGESIARKSATDALPIDESFGDWRYIGPADWPGKVLEIAVSHQTPDVVYAAYGPGGVWKTVDGGVHWLRITPLQGNTLAFGAVEVWPGGDQILAIGSGHGDFSPTVELRGKVWLSHDGGESLLDITPPALGNHAVVRVAFDPADWRRMYVLSTANIFRTDDGGVTWSTRHTFAFKADNWDDLPDLAVDPGNFSRAVFVHPLDGTRATTSGGLSWTPAEPAASLSGPGIVAWSKAEPGTVYVQLRPYGAAKTSIHRSSDAGAHFSLVRESTAFNQGRYDTSMAINPVNPNVILVANSSYEYSNNLLQSSTSTYCCWRVDFSDVVFAPSNPSIVYVGSDQGVYRMVDGGVSIQNATRFDSGVHSQHTFSLAVSRLNSDRVAFANAGDYPTFRGNITNAVQAYVVGPAYEYTAVSVSPHNSNLVFTAGGGDALRRSIDRGVSWNSVEFLNPITREYRAPIEYSMQDPARIFLASKQVYRSLLSGAAGSWTAIGPPPAMTGDATLRFMRVAPSNHDTVYVAGAWGTSEILLTVDGGLTWQKIDVGVPYHFDIAIDPADASKAIISSAFNLKFCSGYLAQCTDRPINGTKLRFVVYDPQAPGRIYGGSELGGVVVSTDAGATWRRLGRNQSMIGVNDLKLQADRLYMANATGMYELRVDPFGQPGTPGGLAAQPGLPVSRTAPAGAPPGAPVYDRRVATSWSAVPGAAAYRLFRGATEVWRGTGVTGIDWNPPVNTSLCYQIVAEFAEGFGAWSTPVCTKHGSFDVDGNAAYQPLTDGLLLIRYLFGLTGSALTSGAIGGGATNTTPEQILQALVDIRPLLDVDGDGRVDPLTDGLMLIRYAFALRGQALIAGAVGVNATRTTAAQIEAYIKALLP